MLFFALLNIFSCDFDFIINSVAIKTILKWSNDSITDVERTNAKIFLEKFTEIFKEHNNGNIEAFDSDQKGFDLYKRYFEDEFIPLDIKKNIFLLYFNFKSLLERRFIPQNTKLINHKTMKWELSTLLKCEVLENYHDIEKTFVGLLNNLIADLIDTSDKE